MSSAFPTLSHTASTIRKSFFDAANIGAINGNALVAIYPLTERKGKARNYFVTVHVTLFEVHKNQKDSKNKKPAKYLVDLGDVFNVSIQNEPIQIKDNCICIMDPNTSFFVKPTDTDYDLQAWFDWILERCRECRSTKLLRPVFHEEYFEAAWDVQIVRKPKLRRDYSTKQTELQNDDLTEKRPQMLGHHRLCICPNSFLLFVIGCRPNSNVDSPFDKSNFIDLPLNVISSYGTQERFFFMRIGRCSEIGSGDIWMATEHGASARAMHERISQINQRESERRRTQGIKINMPTISSSVLKSRAHRERSQTQNQMRKIESQSKLKGASGIQAENDLRKISTASKHNFKPQHDEIKRDGLTDERSEFNLGRSELTTCLQSIPERSIINESNPEQTQNISTNLSSKKNSIVGLFALRIGAKMSTGSFGKQTDITMEKTIIPCSPTNKNLLLDKKNEEMGSNPSLTNLFTSLNQSSRSSLVNTVFGIRLTRRGSILGGSPNQQSTQLFDQKPKQSTASCASFNVQPNYDCSEDYMTYDADERNKYGSQITKLCDVNNKISTNAMTKVESRKSSTSACSTGPLRQLSTNSGGLLERNAPIKLNQIPVLSGDYLEMDNGQRQANIEQPVFALHEVQSYVSNSSESCWTPSSSNIARCEHIAANVPRAYSLGSKPRCAPVNDYKTNLSRPFTSDAEQLSGSNALQSQFLHPCANKSPPNYIKKCLIGKKIKNIKVNEKITTKNDNTIDEPHNLRSDAMIPERNREQTQNISAIVRKRAHSETWVKPSLRKLTTVNGLKKNQYENAQTGISGIDNENFRQNTCGTQSMDSESSCYPHSMEDHVEINFDRDKSPSMDSIPSLQSRHSSVGMQCPLVVQNALDTLTQTPRTKGSSGIKQIERKRSVPEMFKSLHVANNKLEVSSNNPDQNRLHPNRRSTYDTLALRQKFLKKNIEKSPKHCISTFREISESQLSESTAKRLIECDKDHKDVELEHDDDYVILGNSSVRGQYKDKDNQLNIRSIGTIQESSSPCSSMSSDGEWRRRSSKLAYYGRMSPITTKDEFQDEYSILMIKPKMTSQNSPKEKIMTASMIDEKIHRIRLTSTSSQSRSPSHSPHVARRKFSAHTPHPSPARSYFPIHHKQSSHPSSPSPSARRKTTTISDACITEKDLHVHTNVKQGKCDYAYIAET